MGAHKGRKWRDKPSNARYWNENHRTRNKLRRVRKCNGAKFATEWERRYA